MNPSILKRIQAELRRIEKAERIHIIYACESGSRAWGFESRDSDYDVRFIYARRIEWYLTIQNKRDVIERPIDDMLDISGWDLPKALYLLRKSNPPLLEWLQSPIVYRENRSATRQIRDLVPDYYSPVSCMYHYLHMAQGNYREYLQGDEVWVKKYFYVLRPVLACLWIENGLGTVPMEFSVLVHQLIEDEALKRDIWKLMDAKKKGAELDRGPRVPTISEFLDTQLARLSPANQEISEAPNPDVLDKLLIKILVELNGPIIEQSDEL